LGHLPTLIVVLLTLASGRALVSLGRATSKFNLRGGEEEEGGGGRRREERGGGRREKGEGRRRRTGSTGGWGDVYV